MKILKLMMVTGFLLSNISLTLVASKSVLEQETAWESFKNEKVASFIIQDPQVSSKELKDATVMEIMSLMISMELRKPSLSQDELSDFFQTNLSNLLQQIKTAIYKNVNRLFGLKKTSIQLESNRKYKLYFGWQMASGPITIDLLVEKITRMFQSAQQEKTSIPQKETVGRDAIESQEESERKSLIDGQKLKNMKSEALGFADQANIAAAKAAQSQEAADAQAAVNNVDSKLAEAQAAVNNAYSELAEAQAAVNNAEQEVAEAQAAVNKAEQELAEAQAAVNNAEKQKKERKNKKQEGAMNKPVTPIKIEQLTSTLRKATKKRDDAIKVKDAKETKFLESLNQTRLPKFAQKELQEITMAAKQAQEAAVIVNDQANLLQDVTDLNIADNIMETIKEHLKKAQDAQEQAEMLLIRFSVPFRARVDKKELVQSELSTEAMRRQDLEKEEEQTRLRLQKIQQELEQRQGRASVEGASLEEQNRLYEEEAQAFLKLETIHQQLQSQSQEAQGRALVENEYLKEQQELQKRAEEAFDTLQQAQKNLQTQMEETQGRTTVENEYLKEQEQLLQTLKIELEAAKNKEAEKFEQEKRAAQKADQAQQEAVQARKKAKREALQELKNVISVLPSDVKSVEDTQPVQVAQEEKVQADAQQAQMAAEEVKQREQEAERAAEAAREAEVARLQAQQQVVEIVTKVEEATQAIQDSIMTGVVQSDHLSSVIDLIEHLLLQPVRIQHNVQGANLSDIIDVVAALRG